MSFKTHGRILFFSTPSFLVLSACYFMGLTVFADAVVLFGIAGTVAALQIEKRVLAGLGDHILTFDNAVEPISKWVKNVVIAGDVEKMQHLISQAEQQQRRLVVSAPDSLNGRRFVQGVVNYAKPRVPLVTVKTADDCSLSIGTPWDFLYVHAWAKDDLDMLVAEYLRCGWTIAGDVVPPAAPLPSVFDLFNRSRASNARCFSRCLAAPTAATKAAMAAVAPSAA